MNRKQIFFTSPGVAEFMEVELPALAEDKILTKM